MEFLRTRLGQNEDEPFIVHCATSGFEAAWIVWVGIGTQYALLLSFSFSSCAVN